VVVFVWVRLFVFLIEVVGVYLRVFGILGVEFIFEGEFVYEVEIGVGMVFGCGGMGSKVVVV